MAVSHVVDYQIFGDDLQFVEVELDPGETVVAEAGMMMYMENGITFETKMGDGSNPKAGFMDKMISVGKRALTGESLFMTHFTNTGGAAKKHVAFAAPYPGRIVAIDLDEVHGELICQKDSFLCAALGTQISIAFNKRLGAGLFGGEGFILQRLRGDGMAFIHAGGTIVERRLENEKIMVDTGCIVAFEPAIEYNIERAGNLKSMVFGGEGLFLATLWGTGRVWLQSLPFSRLADRILQSAPSAGGKATDEGSIIRGAAKFLQQ
ncbi:MAG: TIGR00266 family protein [Anaerolineae bacterium]|nr:TIGR00266 family protein [Anaerolineae bacterium]